MQHDSACKEPALQHGAPGPEPLAVGQLCSPWCPGQSSAAPALRALGCSPQENQEGFLPGKVGVRHHLESKGGDLGTHCSPEESHASGQFNGWISHPKHFWVCLGTATAHKVTVCVFTCPRHPCTSLSVLNTCISPHLMVMMACGLFPSSPLCSRAPGNRLASAMGAASHIQHHLRLGLPSMLLPFPLRAAHPAARRDVQSLLSYALALRRLEVAFFLF